MVYPTDKGYIAAKVVSTTAPDDRAAVWFEGPDMNSISDIKLFWENAWTSIFILFNIAHVGGTPPSDTTRIWYDNSIDPHIYKIYDAVDDSWRPLNELFPIHMGASPPQDVRRLWSDQSTDYPILKIYDEQLAKWVDLLLVKSITLTADYLVNDGSVNSRILSNPGDNDYSVEIAAGVPVDTSFIVEKLDKGRTFIRALNGVFINDVEGGMTEIQDAMTSAWCRCYAPDKWKIEGNII